jgi:transposase InsO family protein
MEALPLSDTSAAAFAKALTFSWISHFGVPEKITSDRGQQFTSNLWFKLCEMLNISHNQTTAYHPESNSAVKSLSLAVFPRLKQLLALPLCCLMNLSKMKKFLLILLSKIFKKP